MSLELSGTTPAIKGVAGSVSAPAITGDDADTGISFPSANTIKFSTGGVERISITDAGISGTGIGGGKILQVLSTTKSDHFSFTSSSLTEITGLNVTITPSASTSKIFLLISLSSGGITSYQSFNIKRDSTLIAVTTGVDGNDSRHQGTFGSEVAGDSVMRTIGFNFLDTPGDTNAHTYKVFGISTYNNNRIDINRTRSTNNALYNQGATSTITAMEVGA